MIDEMNSKYFKIKLILEKAKQKSNTQKQEKFWNNTDAPSPPPKKNKLQRK